MPSEGVSRGDFRITWDASAVDVDAVLAFLSRSYWAAGMPRDILVRAIAGSMPFSMFRGDEQVGFARVITDRATFAYLSDVYLLEDHRGQGLGRWLIEVILAHPDLQGLRRFSLTTRDAHGLYAPLGFTPLSAPDRHMEIIRPGLYQRPPESAS